MIESPRSGVGGSRCFGRVGCGRNASEVSGGSPDRSGQSTSLRNVRSSVSKITRAGKHGRDRAADAEEAGSRERRSSAHRDPFRRNPPRGPSDQRGSAHEPPPENVANARDVVGILDRRRVRA